jgi:two-component system sensor kinase FixL
MSSDWKKAGALLIAVVIFLVDGFSSLDIAVAVLYILVILISVDLFSKKMLLGITCLCIALTIIAFLISHGVECNDESCGRGGISIAAIAIASLLALKSSASRVQLRAQLELLARSQAFLAGAQRLSLTGSIGFRVPPTDMYWSEEAKRIFEFKKPVSPTLDLMLGVTHPDDQERLRTVLEDVCDSQSQVEVEFRLVMADGRIKYLQMWARQYEIAGPECEFIGALMDITTTRKAEEALHKSQAELAHVTRVTMLGELAASIAHEVNQPLAAVLTDSQAGLRWLGRVPPDYHEVTKAVERIGAQAQRAADVIRRVRDLSKKGAIIQEKLELNSLLAESLLLVERELYINKVTVSTETGSLPVSVYGDKVQLQQVIINLVMNAMQSLCATRDHGRKIVAHINRDNSDHLELIVRDNGGGIPEQDVVNVFSPFFTTKSSGMGVGLSICRSIIEAHAGQIWAENESAGWVAVGFRLPSYELKERMRENDASLTN